MSGGFRSYQATAQQAARQGIQVVTSTSVLRHHLLCAWSMTMLSCASSVGSINDRALMAQSKAAETRQSNPLGWIRSTLTDYQIGSRDLLEIDIYELEEPNKSKLIKTRVSQRGTIAIPLIGMVQAAGKTELQLQADLEARLEEDYLVSPSVSVIVVEHRSRRVTVLGAVESPGAFHLEMNSTTLLDALALAGGPTEKSGSTVYVVRSAPRMRIELSREARPATTATGTAIAENVAGRPGRNLLKLNLADLFERGDPAANCVLNDGDVVHVPAATSIFVSGKVKRGGSFPLRGEITILRAIALAGGLEEDATPGATVLIRMTPEGRRTIPIDLDHVESGTESDLVMQADDVLVISESTSGRTLRGIGNFLRGLFHLGYNLR